ncbi:ribosomal-processing cysteine protease Prp [Brevibacillus sp. NSP2.1]|uniref:ribosomal-processing cysteine protease Prp n=1 Tax=Brevibacillus sp. NSP2.1 TaxID=3003229 RepID=UPI00040B49B1|nr:ribosomal-processing cysteine protease Prp [Brevibacillus sp. NSP2.1]QHZ55806.1 ribosomal-processing cysteine protease Prp [Brevibacillus sp. NSP2.1]
MIKVKAYLDNGEMKIHAVGHAGYAEHGKDIVCAAISTIMQTALLGIQAVAQQYPEYVSLEIQSEEGDSQNEKDAMEF